MKEPSGKKSASNDPKVLIGQISVFIDKAKTHVAEGMEIDLVGLDEHVRLLCECMLKLPNMEAAEYRDKLQEIASALDALKAQLQGAQESIRDEIKELNVRQKAAKAYKTSHSIAPPISDEE